MTNEKIKFDKEWEKDFKEFWKPLLETDGNFDEQKIKNEIHDLAFCHSQISNLVQ